MSTISPRKREEKQRRRTEIIDAAETVFANVEFKRATMADEAAMSCQSGYTGP